MGKLFVDMDGVLADFHGGYQKRFGAIVDKGPNDNVDWGRIHAHGSFFRDLEPLHGADDLWRFVRHFSPTVLTGIPREVPDAADHKREWLSAHPLIGPGVPMIACQSKDKYRYCQPGDILIDDWEKYRHLWESAGGVWITHTDTPTTIASLSKILCSGRGHVF